MILSLSFSHSPNISMQWLIFFCRLSSSDPQIWKPHSLWIFQTMACVLGDCLTLKLVTSQETEPLQSGSDCPGPRRGYKGEGHGHPSPVLQTFHGFLLALWIIITIWLSGICRCQLFNGDIILNAFQALVKIEDVVSIFVEGMSTCMQLLVMWKITISSAFGER